MIELSSWKYQNDDIIPYEFTKYRTEELNIPENNDIMIKKMTGIIHPYEKGMGSAYGGQWKSKKPEDERFLGEPGEIKETISRSGVRQLTKIGSDGRAVMERHFSDHSTPGSHTNPHEHKIDWSKGYPYPDKPINYPGEVPEFKFFIRGFNMNSGAINKSNDDLNFSTISEFKWFMGCGDEIQFEWNGKLYCAFGRLQKDSNSPAQMYIGEGYYIKDGKCYNALSHEEYDESRALWADTADEILEYKVGEDRLRDVITKVKVIERTL